MGPLAPPAKEKHDRSVRASRLLLVVAAVASCAPTARTVPPTPVEVGVPVEPGGPATDARVEVTRRFLAAARAGDFAAVHALLSSRWRARVSPRRLALDFEAEPLAGPRLGAIVAALEQGQFLGDGGVSRLALSSGRAFTLVQEEGAWRVDALE